MDLVFEIPRQAPRITSADFFLEDDHIITGHDNGVVLLWSVEDRGYRIIHRMSSKINTISSSRNNKILIGTHSGEVVLTSLENVDDYEQVVSGNFNVRSRVWESLWISEDRFIVTSTYGRIKLFYKEGNVWNTDYLSGHSNSVFGVGISDNDEILNTGDYFGNLILRLLNNGEYEQIQKLKVFQAVEDIAWVSDEVFAVINRLGKIYLFEKIDELEWNLVFEISDSSNMGKSICITEDGKYIFGATQNEIIQFDRETNQFNTININSSIKISTYKGKLYAITSDGLYILDIEPVKIRDDLIKYKYLKVSVIGHTGVGKSALCSYITTGTPGDAESTFGKNVWEWISEHKGEDRRILFHDHGGQETALSTFLPFLSDSDIIFIIFQQNDGTTLKTAMNIYDTIKDNVGENSKIYFIQTHIDQRMDDLDDRRLMDLLEKGDICENREVCSLDGSGVNELKNILLEDDMWEKTRTMIQTKYTDLVLNIIMDLQTERKSIMSLNEFRDIYEDSTSHQIPGYHLKFLLKNYSDQGIIDYYPDILDIIIIYDEEYNDLKSEIPIYVMKNDGIINIDELKEEFDFIPYIDIIDNIYVQYKIAIENNDYRIFPKMLKGDAIELTSPYVEYLKAGQSETLFFSDQNIESGRLLEALSELKGQCIDTSKMDALFSWKENVVLYYNLSRVGDALEGFNMQISYRIGGKNEEMYKRRAIEFKQILEIIYGDYELQAGDEHKKKHNIKREIKYDVSLSFAGEQRKYVRTVADNFRSEGIIVFFDEFYEAKMWGLDLSEYLWNVYYKESKYCIMFISDEYVSKAWPTQEKRAAIAREIEELGGYILPVRFDNVEVPGLIPTIKYISANKKWPEKGEGKSPEEIVKNYIQKISP